MGTLFRVSVVFLAVILPPQAQDRTVPSPPSARIEGMPPIPATIAEGLGAYAEYRSATFQSWHPIERQMLITTRFANVEQVHVVRGPGRARTQLTFQSSGVPRVGAAWFNPVHGRYFVFRTDAAAGGQRYQLSRYDLDSGRTTLLTDGQSRNSPPVWSRAGTRIAYDSTRRNGKDRDLYVMDPADRRTDRLFLQVQGSWTAVDWSADDRSVLALETISPAESHLWRVDVETGQKVALTERGARPVSFAGSQFSPDGSAIYTITDRDSEFRRLARLDLAKRAWTMLTEDRWDAEGFEISADGRTIAVVLNQGGASELRILDAASGKARPAAKIPAGIVTGLAWHANGTDLAFNLQSTRSANDVYSVNVRSAAVERWTTSETGGVNAESLVDAEIIRWKSFDGREISGLLYRPPARFKARRPVMVNVHGGPEAQERPRWQGRSNYLLNELGVAIIYPNVRGSAGFGKAYRALDDKDRREDAVKDIGALLDWVAAQPALDPARVMLTGGSYGGYVAVAAAQMYPDKVRCVSSGFGIMNFVTELESMDPATNEIRRHEYGDERDPKTRAFLLGISPVTNAARLKAPFLLVQGLNDPRVPPAQTLEMLEAVKKNGTPVWAILFGDEGHDLTKRTNADYNFYAWIMFVERFLIDGRAAGTAP
jgi:dipeptidyl aminopeptidase/acylaminoacyl peptidase